MHSFSLVRYFRYLEELVLFFAVEVPLLLISREMVGSWTEYCCILKRKGKNLAQSFRIIWHLIPPDEILVSAYKDPACYGHRSPPSCL